MQVRARPELRPRLLYYAARNLSGQLRRGDSYLQMRPSSVVVWLAEPLFSELDQFHSIFELRERATHLRYGDDLTLHVLQLSRLRKKTPDGTQPFVDRYAQLAELWGRFLSAKTRLDFVELRAQNPIMAQAVDALEELSTDPDARWLADKRLIDQKFHEMGLAMAREEATKHGFAIGEAKGIAIGEARGEASMLLRLLERKFGKLPNELESRVRAARSHDLERWVERVLDAHSLDDVFGT